MRVSLTIIDYYTSLKGKIYWINASVCSSIFITTFTIKLENYILNNTISDIYGKLLLLKTRVKSERDKQINENHLVFIRVSLQETNLIRNFNVLM